MIASPVVAIEEGTGSSTVLLQLTAVIRKYSLLTAERWTVGKLSVYSSRTQN
jgi:hypothetical protein